MPGHDVHALWNRKLGVPEAVSRRVDRLIDDSRWHDVGRIVVEGRMDLPFLIVVCHDFITMLTQYSRSHVIRAFIMHHVLDYVYKVYTSLPVIWRGEWNAERLVNNVLANLREDVNKLVEGDEESVNEIREVLSQLDRTSNLEHAKLKGILSAIGANTGNSTFTWKGLSMRRRASYDKPIMIVGDRFIVKDPTSRAVF